MNHFIFYTTQRRIFTFTGHGGKIMPILHILCPLIRADNLLHLIFQRKIWLLSFCIHVVTTGTCMRLVFWVQSHLLHNWEPGTRRLSWGPIPLVEDSYHWDHMDPERTGAADRVSRKIPWKMSRYCPTFCFLPCSTEAEVRLFQHHWDVPFLFRAPQGLILGNLHHKGSQIYQEVSPRL